MRHRVHSFQFRNSGFTMKYTLFVFATFLLSQTILAQGKSLDRIAAKVDNYIVLQSDVEGMYAEMAASNKGVADRCGVLQQLLLTKLLAAKAEIDSVGVDDKDIESTLERRMDYMVRTQFGSEEKLIEAYGKTPEALKTDLRPQIKEQLMVQKMQEKITEKLKVTPSEVKRFFSNMPKDSVPYFSTEVEVAQIVKLATIGKEEKLEIKNRLAKLRDRIVDGEDFAQLASSNSDDGSASQGGDLGWAKRGMMVPEFEGTAMKLKRNEVSQPIETEFGFHIIQLLDRKGEEYHARHILVRPNYADADMTGPTRYLDSLRTLIMADSVRFENVAKLYSDDKPTKGSGGLISDPNSRSTKIFMEALDPGVYYAIDTMTVGNVSRPLTYRTDDGKTAMRILYFRKKIPPHAATLEDDWDKIAAAALNEKKAKALNGWFKSAKEEVFINVHDDFKECDILRGKQ